MGAMTSRRAPAKEMWIGGSSTSIVPPTDYWNYLAGELPFGDQIRELHELSDQRLNEFVPNALPGPENSAVAVLDRVVADGWLEKKQRQKCPNCAYELNEAEAKQ